MEKKIAAAYIRVSTDMQTELSPDAQLRLARDHAKKNGMVIPDEYIFYDEGISGKKTKKRDGFQLMIATAKQKPKPFDVILLYKFSRFARNQEDSLVFKNLLRKKCGIDVVSITEPIIDGPFGQLIERIIEWMDEYYSYNLGQEVFKGMSENALRGAYQASPPLGYRIEHKGEGPVIVEEEAKIVRLIFNLYVDEGMTYFQVTRRLNDLGIKTRKGNTFERRTVEYILNNPTYIGYTRWNRNDSELQRVKDKSEWIIAKGSHEPIISEEQFNAAKERISRENAIIPYKARPVTLAKHPFSGVLKCSNCGCTLITNRRKARRDDNKFYISFQCSGYSKGKCTVSHNVSAISLTPVVLREIERTIFSGNLEYTTKVVSTMNIDQISLLEKQLGKLKAKERRIKDSYMNGIDSLEEYKENKELIIKERKEIEDKILTEKKAKVPERSKNEIIDNISSVYKILLDDDVAIEEKNKAIKSVIEKIIIVKPSNEIKVFYYTY